MLYEDTTEILEALGYNPAFGLRDWIDGRHVEDVRAVAEVLDLRQRGLRAQWYAPSEEACFLFSELVDEFAEELDIESLGCHAPSCEQFVIPSFKSFGVDPRYVLDKIAQFFEIHCVDQHPTPCVTSVAKSSVDEWHLRLRQLEGSYVRTLTLARLPMHYRYGSLEEMRFELTRLLQEAIRYYGMSDWYFAQGLSVRRLHWEGASFVEALWGLIEERT